MQNAYNNVQKLHLFTKCWVLLAARHIVNGKMLFKGCVYYKLRLVTTWDYSIPIKTQQLRASLMLSINFPRDNPVKEILSYKWRN